LRPDAAHFIIILLCLTPDDFTLSKLYLQKPNTEYLKKSIGFCGAKLWNHELSGNLRIADCLNSFNTLIADTSLL
jgi:hypothetical protein